MHEQRTNDTLNSESAEDMKSPLATSKPLILHFDINETILLGDIAGGDSVEECLHKIIAKSAFVQVADGVTDLSQFVPTHWWNGTPIASAEGAPDLWTKPHWPPHAAPYYRTALKQKSKTFLNHDGAVYRPAMERLPLPPAEGRFAHILPALFATLFALSSQPQVRIVFRTMGDDLPYIAEAVTAFAQGQHPEYAGFVHEPYIWNQPQQFLRAFWKDDKIFGLCKADGSIVAEGDDQVLQHLRRFSICGIQDDYSHWKKQGFHPEGGKPVWESDTEYHVLFDDNIFPMLPDYSIAGIRRRDKFVSKEGVHLIPVRTLAPMQNTNWFLERLVESKEIYERNTS